MILTVGAANGNTLTGGGRTNTWDSQNRLVKCTVGSNTTNFTYGPDGLRRSMRVNSGPTTYFVLNGQSVVWEVQVGQNGLEVKRRPIFPACAGLSSTSHQGILPGGRAAS